MDLSGIHILRCMYTAVIVEMRKHKALSFVIDNALNCLSDKWKIIIVHGTTNKEYVYRIYRQSSQPHRISFVEINIDNLTREHYSLLWMNCIELYNAIPTEIFLVFQTDSMIFKKNVHLLKDFLEYDYVGAPWNWYGTNNERVGNGGLSLRRKSKMLEIIRAGGIEPTIPEDVFFACTRNASIYKPEVEKAVHFSIESMFCEESFGCHQPWTFHEIYEKVLLYYPEVEQLKALQGVDD